ncbi:MAG: alpha/beta hydrolase [Pseudomonadota bacterium]
MSEIHAIFIVMLLFVITAPVSADSEQATMTSAARQTECVILLHGLTRSERSMRPLAKALRKDGYQVINRSYPSTKYTVAVLSDMAIEGALSSCANETQTIHFVTHSLGGILVRYYMKHNMLPKLGRVVMIAPPNQGSEVVDNFEKVPGFGALNGPAGNELGTGPDSVPNSLGSVDYPVGVIAGTRSINLILSLSLPGDNDGKVTVERTKVEGMTDFVTVAASHPFIMQKKTTIALTRKFLAYGNFASEVPR